MRSIYHFILALLGSVIYGFPSRKIFVLGITGTKGKSSTTEIVNAVLVSAGKKTALLSSVRRKVGDEERANASGNTMPGRFSIQKFLREAVASGAEYAIIEVTSQGVVQSRDRFIEWDAAFFMNISPEHIESHGSFEKYREAKVKFFKDVLRSKKPKRFFFINKDDGNREYFTEAVRGAGGTEVFYFSESEFVESAKEWGWHLETVEGRKRIGEWLLPDFNVLNAAAAAKFAASQDIPENVVRKALSGFGGLVGRFDIVQEEPFVAVVDYAHTPDSLEKIYSSLRRSFLPSGGGRLICVLGSAGGGRDKWKRKVMGGIAGRLCDEIVLTNEDPYDENPEAIMNEIESGFARMPNSEFEISKNYWKILDRREALRKAILNAKPGDVVVATGKGSEPSIHVAGGRTIPWNEREIMRGFLAELFHKNDEA